MDSALSPKLSLRDRFRSGWWTEVVKHRELYLLLIPGLVYLLIFRYAPMYGAQIAFKRFNLAKGIVGSEWIGFDHFVRLFSDRVFPRVVWNTLVLSLMKLVFQFPAPIILALLLNELRNPGYKRVVQTVSYVPHFISWVVVGGLFIDLLSPSFGIVNRALAAFGVERIFFLAERSWIRWILVGTNIYKEVGWGTIIYLAAIAGIDPELYQAAVVDGAGRFRQIWHITIPCIASTTIVLLILRIGQLMNAGMEQVLMMYNPSVYDVVDIIDTYVYRVTFNTFKFDFTTAAGLFKSVVGCVLILGANSVARRVGESSVL